MPGGRIRLAASVAGLSLAAVGVAGCFGDDGQPKPITGVPKDAAAVAGRLQRATARGDYRAICADLFTAGARRRAGGGDCASLLRSQAGGVRRPRIDVLAIEVKGGGARMRVRTRARGQAAATDTMVLVRQGGRYRIDALGD